MEVIDPKAAELRDRSVGELFSRLSREMSLLVHQEIDLAKAELAQQGRTAGKGAVALAIAAIFGLGAFGAATATLILALALVLPAWAAALIVMLVYGLIAGMMALAGKKEIQRAAPPAPQTVETLKENVEWAKTRAKSANHK
jgi:uncharacterized membrane protein YqjE